MSFDIPPLHIPDDSPEGRAIEAIVRRDNVSPEEAIRRALRDSALTLKSPAEEMWGAFSSPEDAAILDKAMDDVRELRMRDRLRDFDL